MTPGVSIHRIHIVLRSCWFVISLFVTILLVLCLWPHFLILIDTCSQIAIALLCLLFVAFSVITPKACRHWRPCWFLPYSTALIKMVLDIEECTQTFWLVHAIQRRSATTWNTLRGNVFKKWKNTQKKCYMLHMLHLSGARITQPANAFRPDPRAGRGDAHHRKKTIARKTVYVIALSVLSSFNFSIRDVFRKKWD